MMHLAGERGQGDEGWVDVRGIREDGAQPAMLKMDVDDAPPVIQTAYFER